MLHHLRSHYTDFSRDYGINKKRQHEKSDPLNCSTISCESVRNISHEGGWGGAGGFVRGDQRVA